MINKTRNVDFADVTLDRSDLYPVQHSKFADHCAVAIAAIMVVGCGIGMSWCLTLFPLQALAVAGLLGAGAFGMQVFTNAEARL